MNEDRFNEIRALAVMELDKKYPLFDCDTSSEVTQVIGELTALIAEVDAMTAVKPDSEDITVYTEWLEEINFFKSQLLGRFPELQGRTDFSLIDLDRDVPGTDLFVELYYPDAVPYFEAGLSESASVDDAMLAYARILAFEPKMHEFLRESVEEHDSYWNETLRQAAQIQKLLTAYLAEAVDRRNVLDRRSFNLEFALAVEQVEMIEQIDNLEDLPIIIPFDEDRITEGDIEGEYLLLNDDNDQYS
jgi:hypothetical protein